MLKEHVNACFTLLLLKNPRRSSRSVSSTLNTSLNSSTGAESSPNTTPSGKGGRHSNDDAHGLAGANDANFSNSANTAADPDIAEANIFFAHQVVPNSCATHSLLSILMNTTHHQGVNLGPLLTEFRQATASLPPNVRGLAIGYMPPLMEAHNRHARQQNVPAPVTTAYSGIKAEGGIGGVIAPVECVRRAVEAAKQSAAADGLGGGGGCDSIEASAALDSATATLAPGESDTFHFVCFLPVGRCLYELDGLKGGPVNHGPLEDPLSHAGWTRQCLSLLQQRMKDVSLLVIFYAVQIRLS